MDRTCLECDESLAGRSPLARYCSEQHRKRAEKRRGERRARRQSQGLDPDGVMVRCRRCGVETMPQGDGPWFECGPCLRFWSNLGVDDPRPCSDCEQVLPAGEFYRDRSRPAGRMYACKSCADDHKKVLCAGGCGRRIFRSATSADSPRCRGCERGPDGLTVKERRRRGAYVLTCAACGVVDTIQPHKGPRGRYCNACSELAKSRRFRPCSECGEDSWLGHNVQRCSPCWAEHRRRFTVEPFLPVVYEGPAWVPPVVHVRSSRTWRTGQCVICAEWFTTNYGDRTCSDACWKVRHREARSRYKAERRARKKKAFRAPVYRKKVFEADGYRCHICGLMTDRTKKVPHPKAPTIDHVIPLAAGGTHEPSNTRTAHFLCNALKRDLGGGEQMLLLAV